MRCLVNLVLAAGPLDNAARRPEGPAYSREQKRLALRTLAGPVDMDASRTRATLETWVRNQHQGLTLENRVEHASINQASHGQSKRYGYW